jgi:hypothetical protein
VICFLTAASAKLKSLGILMLRSQYLLLTDLSSTLYFLVANIFSALPNPVMLYGIFVSLDRKSLSKRFLPPSQARKVL